MTTYNAVRDAIIVKLNTAYPTYGIYGEEIQQGYKRPVFYVQLLPEAEQMLNKAHRQKPILVIVHYFSAAAANARSRDMWEVADALDTLLGASLTVEDRSIYIQETHPEIVDEVLQYQLNLSYIDSRDNAILVTLTDGTKEIVMSEPDLGYVDGEVFPMRELNLKGE
jgi:hypothetical protein